jgi:hypothetical protein
MGLIIRGRSQFNNYRGTDRQHPAYRNEFDETHTLNQMFFKYVEISDNLSVTNNINIAKEIVDTYNRYLPSEKFELLQISEDFAKDYQGEFLGYDVSSGINLSYLSNGLNICNGSSIVYSEPTVFLCLIERFFKPQLNHYCLFNDYELANFLHSCILTMDNLYPNLWDNPSQYKVIGLWKIY